MSERKRVTVPFREQVASQLKYEVGSFDYKMLSGGGSPYAIDDTGALVDSHNTDAKSVYDVIRPELHDVGGGTIEYGGGQFNFSDPIYNQGESGGAVPDYNTYCRFLGNGSQGLDGTDENATIFHFNAGEDGVIVDQHTNNGGWYTKGCLKDLTIVGTFGSEMDSAISVWKSAGFEIDNVRVYYAGSGGHSTEFTNMQTSYVKDLLVESNIANNTNIYVANIDAVAEGYLEQGAHQSWVSCTSALIGGAAGNGAGTRAWEFEIPSGSANLGNIAFWDCEAFSSDIYDTAARYGFYFHNAAGAFDGIHWSGACNFEGLDQTNAEYNIRVDTDAGYFYGDIYNGTFVGGTTGVYMDHATARLGLHSCRDPPDYLGPAAAGIYTWYDTNTPTALVAGTTVHAGSGGNVHSHGEATVLNGTASLVVAHGLMGTPTRVVVSGASNHVEATQMGTDTWGAANFTIRFHGGGNVTANRAVAWDAIL